MTDAADLSALPPNAKAAKSQRRSSFFNLRKAKNTDTPVQTSNHNRHRSVDSTAAASMTTSITTPPPSSYMSPASITASIPTRTSSHKATTNGDRSGSPGKSPPNNRSLGAVPEERRRLPEVNEQVWISQGRNSRMSSKQSAYPAPVGMDGSRQIGQDLIEGNGVTWSAEKENILKAPFDYLESHPGKDIRTWMITAFNAWLQVPPASLQVISKVVTMLHTASLLIDDVEDNSQLRRGVPVAHSIFGVAQTINSSNYVYFCALRELMTLNNPEVVQIFTEELLCLHRGQGMDLFWRDTLTCPTEDDYLEMVGNKTGGLFRLAIKLMCAEAPSYKTKSEPSRSDSPQVDYVPLVNTIGLLFQILDDYRNLSDTTYTVNKGLCEDLTEGKFSFPIIHAIRADPSNLVLINILKQKTTDDEVKRYAVAYMDRAGSFSYTRRVLRGLTKKALTLVDQVDAGRGQASQIRAVLEKLRVDKSSEHRAS